MSTAKISNPRKQFKFSIEIIGNNGVSLEPFLVQEVNHPDVDTEQDTHGDTVHDIKTAGRVTVGNATISKIMRASGPDNYVWNWRSMCQNILVGGGLIPDQYKRTVLVSEFDESGSRVINTWRWEGCWPTKINGQQNTRTESGNTIESFELSVDVPDKF